MKEQVQETLSLNGLKNGESAMVLRIDVTGRTKRRLVEMGLTPGTKITISKRAPLGDPIEISLRGYELTLREEDAQQIQVVRSGKERVQA